MIFTTLHIGRFAILILIMLLPACATQPARSSRPPKSPPASMPGHIPERAVPRETVTVGGETYSIPSPWLGNRFSPPKFDSSDFRRIPSEYTHNGGKVSIAAPAHEPLVALLRAAEEDGIVLTVESAYRSAGYQKRIFKRMLGEGRTFEDIVRYVAPPGYSQHMLGTAVDFFPSDWRFADTTAYTWLQENARRFGFEESYSQFNPMKFPWEAWHWNFTWKEEGSQTVSDLFPTGTKKRIDASPNGQDTAHQPHSVLSDRNQQR